MSNRSYVIVQTFIHSWRTSLQTFVNSVSNKHHSWTHTRHRVQQTRAVWAKRTEYSIEQIRQSLQRLKIAKIVRMQNLHNFRTIDSVFFRHTFAIQVVNHWPTPIANSYGRALVTLHAHALAFLETTLPIKKGKRLSQSRHMSNYSYVVSATCRHRLFPLCYESWL